jgi:hypothetical protein
VGVGIHCLSVTYIRPIQIEDEVTEGGEWKDPEILLPHQSSLLWCWYIMGVSIMWLHAMSEKPSFLDVTTY